MTETGISKKDYCIVKGTEKWVASEQAREIRNNLMSQGVLRNQVGLTSQKFANGVDKEFGYLARVWIKRGIKPWLETSIGYVPRESQIGVKTLVPMVKSAKEADEEPKECLYLATLNITKKDRSALSKKDKEVYNYHHVTSLLSEYGFGCDLVHNDDKGADFLAYHAESGKVLKVQLKGEGLHIAKKYEGKGLHIACLLPGERWILIPHDELKRLLEKLVPNAFTGRTWKEKGTYFINPPSAAQIEQLEPYIL